MSQHTKEARSELQQVIVEQALAYATELEQACKSAPTGQSLDSCEAVVLTAGRQFLRDSLAATLQSQIREAEKKGGAFAPVHVARIAATRVPTQGT